MQLGLAGHALFETMSVMSRLPGSSRRSIDAVHRAVTGSFPHTQFLSARASARIAASVASLGIGGGAIYDALVAAAALEHGLPLATRDVRALATYRAIGCELMIVN
jgi:predicted nucleic acid-binding protein